MSNVGGELGDSSVSFESLLTEVQSVLADKFFLSGFYPASQEDFCNGFVDHSLLTHPRRSLFHYYPDTECIDKDGKGLVVNYSRVALSSGKVHFSSPRSFNDPYDCTLSVEMEKSVTACIIKCAGITGLGELSGDNGREIADDFAIKWCLRDKSRVSKVTQGNSAEALSVRLFCLKMEQSAKDAGRLHITGKDVVAGAYSVIYNILSIGDRMRVFCLTTTNTNPAMWAYYANGHRGFCVEYDLSASPALGCASVGKGQLALLSNTRPVIYGMERPDCTSYVLDDLFSQIDEKMMNELYSKSLYSKGLNWALECEWRTVLPNNHNLLDEHDNVAFFPIKAVYAGAMMGGDKYDSLLSICRSMKLPFYKIEPHERLYELKVRSVL